MTDAISRSAVLEVGNVRRVTEYDEAGYDMTYNAVPVDVIEALSAVDAVPAERFGEFGKLFVDYKGCPRGAMGRLGGVLIEEEVLYMKPITDVDGGHWIPVNEDALHELVAKYKQLRDAVPKWIGVEEKLPRKDQSVYILIRGRVSYPAKFYSEEEKLFAAFTGDGFFMVGCDRDGGVTHWAPLPKAPEEEG